MAAEAHVANDAIGNVKEDLDLVPAQRICPLGAGCRRWQLALVAWRAIVVEDHLAVEIFEVAHRGAVLMVDRFAIPLENTAHVIERFDERIDIAFSGIQVHAGTGGGIGADQAHERFGTVVAGTDVHIVLI